MTRKGAAVFLIQHLLDVEHTAFSVQASPPFGNNIHTHLPLSGTGSSLSAGRREHSATLCPPQPLAQK